MLSIFPDLLTFGILSPFIIRIAVSVIGLKYGLERLKKPYKWLSVFYIITSIFIFIGLFTQVAVLVAIALAKIDYYINRNSGEKPNFYIYSLIIAVLLSLLLTGPGFLAFDLPL